MKQVWVPPEPIAGNGVDKLFFIACFLALDDFLADVGEIPHDARKVREGERDFFIVGRGAAQRRKSDFLPRGDFEKVLDDDAGEVRIVADILPEEIDGGQLSGKMRYIYAPDFVQKVRMP